MGDGVTLLVNEFVGRNVVCTEAMPLAAVDDRTAKKEVGVLLLVALLLVAATAIAADLRITDSRGTRVRGKSAKRLSAFTAASVTGFLSFFTGSTSTA